MAHEHGPHQCYCPSCGYEVEVEAYVKCNTQICPCCGGTMRAKETGELRMTGNLPSVTIAKEGNMPLATETLDSLSCPVCKFPILIKEDTYEGQQIKCPSCGSINEAIAQVTIPTPVFVGILCFGFGALLGPALWATTKGGAELLARKARERLG